MVTVKAFHGSTNSDRMALSALCLWNINRRGKKTIETAASERGKKYLKIIFHLVPAAPAESSLYNFSYRKKERFSPSVMSSEILTNEMIAANNRILTKRSSNCSSTNCHIDLPSSVGSSEMVKEISLIKCHISIVVSGSSLHRIFIKIGREVPRKKLKFRGFFCNWRSFVVRLCTDLTFLASG